MYKMSYVGCINRRLRKFTTDQIRADDNTEKSGAIWSGDPPVTKVTRNPEGPQQWNSNIISLLLMQSPPLCNIHM